MIEIDRRGVPFGKQIVKSTWAFQRKQRPNGEIHELKAQFVVRGDLQVLNEHEGAYSPVVDWSTVRLLFILAVAQQLQSITINFNSALGYLPDIRSSGGKMFMWSSNLYMAMPELPRCGTYI
jgi:hypothetical protein